MAITLTKNSINNMCKVTQPKQLKFSFQERALFLRRFLNAKYFITIISDETQIPAAIFLRKYIFLCFLLKCVQKVKTSSAQLFPDFENSLIRTIIKHMNNELFRSVNNLIILLMFQLPILDCQTETKGILK